MENVSQAGLGVDSSGGPVIDPTKNVISLVVAESKRQDDLRSAAKELADVKTAHQKEIAELLAQKLSQLGEIREKHQRDLDAQESNRLNAIRQVDREEVSKTAAAAQMAITTLANTTNTMAETLRTQVANVAAAVESRQSAFAVDVNKRISALELSSSEGKGKQAVSDPQMDRLSNVVEQLARAQSTGTGHGQGMSDSAKMIIFVLGVITTLMGFYTFTQRSNTTSPQVIYVPAPAVAQPMPK